MPQSLLHTVLSLVFTHANVWVEYSVVTENVLRTKLTLFSPNANVLVRCISRSRRQGARHC
ncbi:hypothetical protein BGX33_010022 [Mortierella sp. NVP41]|nr:hypothetical protein BGX33_010022 [Mortierella sp. NVP41]